MIEKILAQIESSDMVIHVIILDLPRLFQACCKKPNLNLKLRFKPKAKNFLLPLDGNHPAVFIPSEILTDLPGQMGRVILIAFCARNEDLRNRVNEVECI
jgi:hypothetical protein